MNAVEDQSRPPTPATGESADARPRRPTRARPEAELDPVEREARAAFDEARSGRPAAYGTVVRLYHDRLYNAVYRLVRHHDDAAELTQEAFTRGFEKMGGFRGDSGPYTWLFRIAMNAAVTRIRKGRRRRTGSLDALDADAAGVGGYQIGGGGAGALPDRGVGPADRAEQSEDGRAVLDALGRLDAEYRAILVMRDLEGFDYRQMAEILDLPLGTLKSRLFRARVALRELLQDHFAARRGRDAD